MSACPPAIKKIKWLGFSGFGNVNYCGSFFVAAADTEQVKKIDMCGAKGIRLLD
jgi:hypothetical protein